MMEDSLKGTGIRKPLESGKRRHEFQADHGFRKFFKSVYSGDSMNLGSSGTFSLSVTAFSTITVVGCDPISITAGELTTCTATVTGLSPTGSVGWYSSSATGSFSLSSCDLTSDSCAVYHSDPTSGGAVIEASYFGDSYNLASSGATIFGNFEPSATAAALTQTSVRDRTGSDQTAATGVATTVTGSSSEDGTPVTIFSADLSSLPSGTPIPLGGAAFYYVEVYGIFDGTARECISNLSVGSAAQFDYNSGYGWLAATATIVVSGASMCGDVPVSALTGAYLAIGYPLPATATIVQLSPDSVPSGNLTIVTATVAGANATGTVSWTSDGWGTFSSDTWNLVDSTCSVVFTPYTAFGSPQTITASYRGDSSNAASNGTALLTILQHSTSTTVACSPSPGQVGVPTARTVTVSDTKTAPRSLPQGR